MNIFQRAVEQTGHRLTEVVVTAVVSPQIKTLVTKVPR